MTKVPRIRNPKRTADEVQASIDFCEECLLMGYRRSEIKSAYRKKFGDFGARAIDEYTSRARREINRLDTESLEIKRVRAIKRYASVFKRASVPWAVRVRALENIDRIEGTHAPVQITGAEGAPLIPPSQTNVVIYIPEKRKLTEIELNGRSNGNGNGNGSHGLEGDPSATDPGIIP